MKTAEIITKNELFDGLIVTYVADVCLLTYGQILHLADQ